MAFVSKSFLCGASLFVSSIGLQAHQEVHLTKTQKQIQQYVTETLTELGIASENPEFLDPREAIGLSKKANKKWTVLKLLEAQTTNRTANDHALHVFGDRMKEMRTERRTQINNLIAGLNEVFHRNLTNQSVSRALGIRLIDFFNDQHVEHDCDETLQQNAQNFLDLVNKNFHSPAFKLPYEAKDLKRLSVLYYYPDYEPGVEEPDDWCDDLEFLSTHLDLNGQTLTLTGDYQLLTLTSTETLYQLMESVAIHCLRNGKQEQTFTGLISDTGNAGTLAVTGGSHVLNTEPGSVVQNLNLTGGELTLGGEGDGTLSVRGPLEIAENAVLKVGSEAGTGLLTVTGMTTNNGRVEILKTKDGSPAKFGAYTGTGNTYIAPGATMEVAFNDYWNGLECSGNFEGCGHLILSGDCNEWLNMGTGCFETLTVNVTTDWNQAEGAESLTVTGRIFLGDTFTLGSSTPCSLTCSSLTATKFGFGGGNLTIQSNSKLTCSRELRQDYGTVYVEKGGSLSTKIYVLSDHSLEINEGDLTVQEEMSTAEKTQITCSGKLTVGGVLTHNGTIDVLRLTDAESLVLGGLEGKGTVNLNSNVLTIHFHRDCLFEGRILGAGTVHLHSKKPITFTWPQGVAFTGSVTKDDTVTVVHSGAVNLLGQVLTLSGNAEDPTMLVQTDEVKQLSEAKTVQTLTSVPDQTTYTGFMGDTENAGSLVITGGCHMLNTEAASAIQNLILNGGELALGSETPGTLSVKGSLEVAENAVLKIGSEEQGGIVKVTDSGSTINNGRIEVLKPLGNQVVPLRYYQGTGDLYLAKGATVEVCGGQSDAPYNCSGRFEGEGNLVTNDSETTYWENMGGGTLGSLTINNRLYWRSMKDAEPLVVTGDIKLYSHALFGQDSPMALTSSSCIIGRNGSFYLVNHSTLTCKNYVHYHDSQCTCLAHGATLTTKTCLLEDGSLTMMYSAFSGDATVIVQDTMRTEYRSSIWVRCQDKGKLTVEGVLTHNGKMLVNEIADAQSVSFGGLEGSGIIQFHNPRPMTIHFTRDCTFTGTITGEGTLSLHSETPVTFTWPRRSQFTGTLNKDETVNIVSTGLIVPDYKTLTVTGNDVDEELCVEADALVELTGDTTARALTTVSGQTTYCGILSGRESNLMISGGVHALNTSQHSSVCRLQLTGGELTVGSQTPGFLTVNYALEIAQGAVLKVGSALAPGMLSVLSHAENNGRLEIYNVPENEVVKLQHYQGSGDTYLAQGTTMEVALVPSGTYSYSGNVEGEGNLIVSNVEKRYVSDEARWTWSGNGTLESLTINSLMIWVPTRSSATLNVTNALQVSKEFQVGGSGSCTLSCGSLLLENRGTLSLNNRSTLTCSGEASQDVSLVGVWEGSQLTTKTYALGSGTLDVGYTHSGGGTMIVAESMTTSRDTKILVGNEATDYASTFTVGGVLTHNGSLNIYQVADAESLMFGGLEGTGTIKFYDTNTQPMTINFTRDCTFTGKIECRYGATPTLNLHSETPVTFTWPQRSAFTGTVNKDDTVTIQEA